MPKCHLSLPIMLLAIYDKFSLKGSFHNNVDTFGYVVTSLLSY